ncbi:hypothetical protein H312_01762 [Anncaliia algerae PRA339]|uniref:Uncharacterized protein n=1 Tax=Anncaliia algerae PRA339 TaxID=1288291 RepID=A0A059F0W4_9MICR|nr:hypothetical protein H312_01762 [Anncaliia algerae PRA339]
MDYFDHTLTSLLKVFTKQDLVKILEVDTNITDILQLETKLFIAFKDVDLVERIIDNLSQINTVKEDVFLLEETRKVLEIPVSYCKGCDVKDCVECKLKIEREVKNESYSFNKIKISNKKLIKKYSEELNEDFLFSHIENKIHDITLETNKIFLFPLGFDVKHSVLFFVYKEKNNISVITDDEDLFIFLERNKINVTKSHKARRHKLREKIVFVNVTDECLFIRCKDKRIFLFYYQVGNLLSLAKYFKILPKDVFLFKNSFYETEFITPGENNKPFVEDTSNHLGYFPYNNDSVELHNEKILQIIDKIHLPAIIFTKSKNIASLIFKKRLSCTNDVLLEEIPELTKEQQNFISQKIGVIRNETNVYQINIIKKYFNEKKINLIVSEIFLQLNCNTVIFSKFNNVKPCFLERNENQKIIYICDSICKPNNLILKTRLFNLVNSILQREGTLEELSTSAFNEYTQEEINYTLKKLIYFDLIKYGNKLFLPTQKGKLVDTLNLHEENVKIFFNSKVVTDKDVLLLLSKAYELKSIKFASGISNINYNAPLKNRIYDEVSKNQFIDYPIPCMKNDFIYEFINLIRNNKSKLNHKIINLLNSLFFIFLLEGKEKALFTLLMINLLSNKNSKCSIITKSNQQTIIKGEGEVDVFLMDYNGDYILEHKRVNVKGKCNIKFRKEGIVCAISGKDLEFAKVTE